MYQTIKTLNDINICFLNNQKPRSCLKDEKTDSDQQLYFYQSDTNNPLHCQSNLKEKK